MPGTPQRGIRRAKAAKMDGKTGNTITPCQIAQERERPRQTAMMPGLACRFMDADAEPLPPGKVLQAMKISADAAEAVRHQGTVSAPVLPQVSGDAGRLDACRCAGDAAECHALPPLH